MADNSTRPPTPAEKWVSPLAAYSNGNLYPYWNLKDSGLTPYITSMKRAFSFLNPFAIQQVPTHDRAGIAIMDGAKFYQQQPYPNSIAFTDKFPSHYDPLADERFKPRVNTRHVDGSPKIVMQNAIPKFCHRQVKMYRRCLVANDNRADVCQQQQQNIMSICPAFALDQMQQFNLANLKQEGLNNQKYRKVMEVPSYNKGRTVADVPQRSWAFGSMYRPPTLWADDRYADITEEEVLAAQQRINKRRAANPEPKYQVPVYDRRFEVPPKDTRYSL